MTSVYYLGYIVYCTEYYIKYNRYSNSGYHIPYYALSSRSYDRGRITRGRFVQRQALPQTPIKRRLNRSRRNHPHTRLVPFILVVANRHYLLPIAVFNGHEQISRTEVGLPVVIILFVALETNATMDKVPHLRSVVSLWKCLGIIIVIARHIKTCPSIRFEIMLLCPLLELLQESKEQVHTRFVWLMVHWSTATVLFVTYLIIVLWINLAWLSVMSISWYSGENSWFLAARPVDHWLWY
jgi:hypothetical protein